METVTERGNDNDNGDYMVKLTVRSENGNDNDMGKGNYNGYYNG